MSIPRPVDRELQELSLVNMEVMMSLDVAPMLINDGGSLETCPFPLLSWIVVEMGIILSTADVAICGAHVFC